ncbi:MAG TPA: sugar phosphate isomerase/epimerase [Anaerolineae bacterium]|nr:sugar phosphate isomerase/epimerase [Anaerolineae bacterium]HQI86141.1 sugar phosphate isomerase/epimerase [Anaerolineae bacterium]
MKVNIALITGIIRDEVVADVWGALAQVAAMGYQGLEFGPDLAKQAGLSHVETKRRLDDLGLQTFSYGTVLHPQDMDKLDGLIEEAHIYGCRYLVTFWAPCDSREQVLAYADFFNRAGAKLKANGLTLCYHNHDHEFRGVFDGERGIDILFANTDPDLVKAEIDVAWVHFGGADPVQHIEAFKGRCPLIHIKDIYSADFRNAWTEVGTGIVNIKGAIEAGARCGADWFIVEQDNARDLPPMESIRASIENLRAMGFV